VNDESQAPVIASLSYSGEGKIDKSSNETERKVEVDESRSTLLEREEEERSETLAIYLALL
jgi:hypothetical protein